MTLNLNSSMSYDVINAKIELLPRFIPPGKVLTVQFADGTYTLGDSLYFANFWGGGSINIQGNTGETNGLHTNQAVILSTVAAVKYGLRLYGIGCIVNVGYLRVDVSTSGGQTGLYCYDCDAVRVYNSYMKGNSVGGAGYMVYNFRSKLFINQTYIDNSYCALLNFTDGYLATQNNSSTVNNQYTIISIGATFTPPTGTQPGSNAGSAYQQGGS